MPTLMNPRRKRRMRKSMKFNQKRRMLKSKEQVLALKFTDNGIRKAISFLKLCQRVRRLKLNSRKDF